LGPIPPPYGGVSVFLENTLKYGFNNNKLNINIFLRPTIGNSNIFSFLINELRLIFLFLCIKNNDYDIIHIHTASYWSFYKNLPYIFITKYILKLKIILHVHGGGFKDFYYDSNFIIKSLIRKSLNISDCLVLTSNCWIPIFKKITTIKKIIVITNGFDERKFNLIDQLKCREKLSLPNDKKIFINIAYLSEEKGHKFLIDAMNNIIKYNKNILCIIIGEGLLRNSLEKKINELNLKNHVLLKGSIDHSQIPLWLNAGDIFVLPSIIEGNPTVMFEAMGCGKPFVGSSVGGIPDVITSGDYGLLSIPGNSTDLEEKMFLALQKNWDIPKILIYSKKFSWSNIFNKLENLYLET